MSEYRLPDLNLSYSNRDFPTGIAHKQHVLKSRMSKKLFGRKISYKENTANNEHTPLGPENKKG